MRPTRKRRSDMGALGYVREKAKSGVWMYERRVPKAIRDDPSAFIHFDSKPLFRRSLLTKVHAEAFEPASRVHAEFEKKLRRALGEPDISVVTPPSRLLKQVTQSDIDRIAQRYRELTRSRFERAQLLADSDPDAADELKRLHYQLEMDAAEINSILVDRKRPAELSPYEAPADTARWIIGNEGYDAPEGSVAFGSIANAVRSGTIKGYSDIDAMAKGLAIPKLEADSGSETPPMTISEAVERYLIHGSFPPKTATEAKLALKQFISVVGNKSIESLKRADFQKFLEFLAGQKVGGRSAGSVKRPMSKQTLQKRLGFLRSAIRHAIERGWFVDPSHGGEPINPASGLKLDAYVAKADPAVTPPKRRFKIDELNRIFAYPWFAGCKSPSDTHTPGTYRLQGSEYWAPVVALYTGARASELGGMAIGEVKITDAHPHFVIRDNEFRRTKRGNIRNVPILDALFELGFGEYYERVAASGASRLFPDWHCPKGSERSGREDAAWSNAKIIRAFNRTVIPSALKGEFVTGSRQPVTFHSFRGAFKALLNDARYKLSRNLINEVIGHKKDEMDERYIGEHPIEETYPAIRSCKYSGLIIPFL